MEDPRNYRPSPLVCIGLRKYTIREKSAGVFLVPTMEIGGKGIRGKKPSFGTQGVITLGEGRRKKGRC